MLNVLAYVRSVIKNFAFAACLQTERGMRAVAAGVQITHTFLGRV